MKGLIARKIDFQVNLGFNWKTLKFWGQIIIFRVDLSNQEFHCINIEVWWSIRNFIPQPGQLPSSSASLHPPVNSTILLMNSGEPLFTGPDRCRPTPKCIGPRPTQPKKNSKKKTKKIFLKNLCFFCLFFYQFCLILLCIFIL